MRDDRLAVVTPWPPQRNGIADYAFAIAQAGEPARIVTDAAAPRAAPDGCALLSPRAFLAAPADVAIYHVGNNADHVFLVPLFLRRPGIVVLHDLSLHYLVHLADRLFPGFHAAQLAAESDAVARLFASLAPAGLSRPMDHREIRLLAWLGAARAIIVHSQAARRSLAAALPNTPAHVVPHFCYVPGPSLATLLEWRDAVRDPVRARWMAGLAWSGPAFVLVALGAQGADSQLAAVLGAIARLPDALRGQTALLVAGAARAGDPDLCAVAARLGCADRVRLLGWVDETEAERLLLAADLVMALRVPTRGESSGVVARALGLGCATVVSDHGGYAELPDEAVIKLPARFDVTNALHTLLRALIADRSRIVRTRAAAYRHARTVGGPDRAAARIAAVARAA